jgi:hypothetical protein
VLRDSDGTITADYNDTYNVTDYGVINGTYYPAWSGGGSWQAAGYDIHGVNGNPLLSGAYMLGSGSPAIGTGTNLTSLGIAALNSDAAGVARPSSGAWDIGAFQFVGGSVIISGKVMVGGKVF